MSKKIFRTTILIPIELWRNFRIRAMQEGKSSSSLLEEIIRKKLSEKKEN
jgi:hypothetical protein